MTFQTPSSKYVAELNCDPSSLMTTMFPLQHIPPQEFLPRYREAALTQDGVLFSVTTTQEVKLNRLLYIYSIKQTL